VEDAVPRRAVRWHRMPNTKRSERSPKFRGLEKGADFMMEFVFGG
jgi:hypothetical protein